MTTEHDPFGQWLLQRCEALLGEGFGSRSVGPTWLEDQLGSKAWNWLWQRGFPPRGRIAFWRVVCWVRDRIDAEASQRLRARLEEPERRGKRRASAGHRKTPLTHRPDVAH